MLKIYSKVILPVIILIGIALARKPYAPTVKHDFTIESYDGGNKYHPICDSDDEAAGTCSKKGGPNELLISDCAMPGETMSSCRAVVPDLDLLYTVDTPKNDEVLYKPWEPAPRLEAWWFERHRQILKITETYRNDIEVVFIGSSVVEFWNTTGKEIWDAKYAPLGSVNYGIYADGTEQVLWRIENGELDGLSPQLVVVYVGSNNIPFFSVEDCVRGVNTVIDKLHEKLPDTNILYVSPFPRGDQEPVIDMLKKIRNVTDTLKPLIDGDESRNSHFLDIFFAYAPESLERIYEEFYVADKLHQNVLGYQLWHDLMNTKFYSLLN